MKQFLNVGILAMLLSFTVQDSFARSMWDEPCEQEIILKNRYVSKENWQQRSRHNTRQYATDSCGISTDVYQQIDSFPPSVPWYVGDYWGSECVFPYEPLSATWPNFTCDFFYETEDHRYQKHIIYTISFLDFKVTQWQQIVTTISPPLTCMRPGCIM